MTKTLNDQVLEFIDAKKEFRLLDIYHREYFYKELSEEYTNYTLDVYNYYIKITNKLNAKRLGLLKTIKIMYENSKKNYIDYEEVY